MLHNVSMPISNPEVEAGDKTDGIIGYKKRCVSEQIWTKWQQMQIISTQTQQPTTKNLDQDICSRTFRQDGF